MRVAHAAVVGNEYVSSVGGQGETAEQEFARFVDAAGRNGNNLYAAGCVSLNGFLARGDYCIFVMRRSVKDQEGDTAAGTAVPLKFLNTCLQSVVNSFGSVSATIGPLIAYIFHGLLKVGGEL